MDTLLYVLKFLFILFIMMMVIKAFMIVANYIGEGITNIFRYVLQKVRRVEDYD